MALDYDKKNEAIKQMVVHLKLLEEQRKAGVGEYGFYSARQVLRTLGYSEDDQQEVLQEIADRGFDYCLDANVGHRERDTEEVTYPPHHATQWGQDQLLSRLRFVER